MSSRRFPGKVLAPFRGEPIVRHVVRTVSAAVDAAAIVVATSTEPSDDPLVAYLRDTGVPVFRGPLDDVLSRFVQCAATHPARWFLRVSADSPTLDPNVIAKVVAARSPDVDLVTTIFPRTFPKGMNAELLSEQTLATLDAEAQTSHDREHVTALCYAKPERFRIFNVVSADPALAHTSVAVDTVEDLLALEESAAKPHQ